MSYLNKEKANLIRTKLLLLISNEEKKRKIEKGKNLLRLNSKSFEEINEKYKINNFKITMENKRINGGKNLCISYSSKINPRPLLNSEDESLKNYMNNKMEFEKYLDSIKINDKRKISEVKLKCEKKKKKINFNLEKEKLMELQKKSVSKLRKMVDLFINFSKLKNKKMKRQKSVKIKLENNMKNTYNKNLHYSSKVSLFSKNKFKRNAKKKKTETTNSKIITDIIDYNVVDVNSKSTKFSYSNNHNFIKFLNDEDDVESIVFSHNFDD